MTGGVIGAASGAVLAIVALVFGFWGFLLVLLFGLIGLFIGLAVSGRIDVRAVTDALRGRRSA
jgi:uncharacterized membrane protein